MDLFILIEVENAKKYTRSKLFNLLVGIKKTTQDASRKVYGYVPLQDFTSNSDINWEGNIDNALYEKYGLNEEEINYVESIMKDIF